MTSDGFKWIEGGWDTLASYKWYSDYYGKHVDTRYCSDCGTFFGGNGHDFIMLNARTFDDVDTTKLLIQPFDARGRTEKMDAEDAEKAMKEQA